MRRDPTAALLRAVVLATLGCVLAVLAGRPAALVVVAPFVAWSALGLLRRPPRVEEPPRLQISSRRLQVGEAVRYEVSTGQSQLLADLDLAVPSGCEVSPQQGAVTAPGRAGLVVTPLRWGRHTLPPGQVEVVDDWGMWAGGHEVPEQRLTVSPGRDLPGGGDSIPHPVGLVGLHPSRLRGEGSSLAEIRPFQTGDRLRRVNWRVTARTGQLHSTATNADRDTEVLVVTDTTCDLTTAEVDPRTRISSLDTTVVAAATVSEHYLALGDRVGLHDLGSVIGSVPAGTGSRQRTVITEQLSRASIELAQRGTIRRIGRVRSGSLAVVCSPLMDRMVLEEIARLVHRGVAVVAVDTLPAELGQLAGPPQLGQRLAARLSGAAVHRRFWAEAWAIRRMERDVDLRGIEQLGVPVVAWRGMVSVGTMVSALASSRAAARLGPGVVAR